LTCIKAPDHGLAEPDPMSAHHFQLRLVAHYTGSENQVRKLVVEQLQHGAWEPFNLSVTSPGFSVLVYAIFSCQHLYLRINAMERGLVLDKAEGEIELEADDSWRIRRSHLRFAAITRSGQASEDDLEYIRARMGNCPASRNLLPIDDARTEVTIS
jgi:uncharacterized OsmC-like protein